MSDLMRRFYDARRAFLASVGWSDSSEFVWTIRSDVAQEIVHWWNSEFPDVDPKMTLEDVHGGQLMGYRIKVSEYARLDISLGPDRWESIGGVVEPTLYGFRRIRLWARSEGGDVVGYTCVLSEPRAGSAGEFRYELDRMVRELDKMGSVV